MNFRRLCLLLAVASLSACDLGDGSRPVSVTIIPAGVVKDGTLQMTECFREPLALQVTFSDGQIGNATSRAIWSSSDDSVVQVSNGGVAAQEIINGEFGASRLTFGRGVLIPKAATTTPVIITADFLGLKADLPVVVDSLESASTFTGSIGQAKAELVPRPVVGGTPSSPKFIGEGFSERFTIRLTKNGRLLDAGDFSRTDSIFNSFLNPVRWTFNGGATFVPANLDDDSTTNNTAVFVPQTTPTTDADNDGDTDDDDRRLNAIATLVPNGGLVTGVTADAMSLTVVAELSSVDGGITSPCEMISAQVRIAELAKLAPDNRQLLLEHERNFNGMGTTATGDIVVGTNELLQAKALLDTDGDLATFEQEQVVTSQVNFEVIEADRDACTINNNVTPPVTSCASSILSFGFGGLMTTVPGTNGSFATETDVNPRTPQPVSPDIDSNMVDDRFRATCPDPGMASNDPCLAIDAVRVRACFPLCANSVGEPASPSVFSNELIIRAVPARLDPASPVVIQPDAPVSQLAFTVPGIQFKAYGTYTAGSIVNGAFVAATAPEQRFNNNNSTATQNIGRYLSWFARPAGDDSAISDVAQLTNGSSNGSVEATGQVFYICNPESVDELIDIYAITNNTAVVSTDISDDIAPVTLTVKRNPAVSDRACEP